MRSSVGVGVGLAGCGGLPVGVAGGALPATARGGAVVVLIWVAGRLGRRLTVCLRARACRGLAVVVLVGVAGGDAGDSAASSRPYANGGSGLCETCETCSWAPRAAGCGAADTGMSSARYAGEGAGAAGGADWMAGMVAVAVADGAGAAKGVPQ